MASSNIINAVFGSGICAVTTSAFRANYGMVLRFSGIDLPTAFECDFSNYDVAGRDSITAIGQNGEVQIPDDLWDSGLNIYAYVYLHPTDDSGVTVYTVTIPVLGRPNRTDETPTPHEQTVIEQAISALNDAVEQTAADVASADASASAAAQSEANAATSERSAAASASAALASQNAAESAAQSATESASGASESAQNAANSASQAAESATAAQESAEQAESSVQSIGDDVERAERAAQTATDKATEASGSAATANAKATEAAQSAQSAASAAQNAAQSAQLAESHATDAEQAKQGAQDAQGAAEAARDEAVAAVESVADKAAQIAQNTADIADLVQSKAGVLVDTATGSIASFVPDATVPTVKGLTVDIEPVQDLHGYDSPWPAGGGKNLIDPLYIENLKYIQSTGYIGNTTGWSISGFIPVEPGETYILNIQNGGTAAYHAFYDNSKAFVSSILSTTSPITIPEGIAYVRLSMRTRSNNTAEVAQFERGTTSTSWTPYSNICPISGWDAVKVQRTGKNLLRLVESEMVRFGWNRQFPFSIKAGTYTISCQNQFGGPENKGAQIRLYDEDSNLVTYLSNSYAFGKDVFTWTNTITEEQAAKVKYVLFECNSSGATYESLTSGNLQLERGSTATAYTPYQGDNYQIQLGQTVYGGTVDAVNGVLTVDRAMVDLGTLTWNKINTTGSHWRFWAYLNDMAYGGEMLSSQYKHITASQSYLGDIGIASQASGGSYLAMVTDERFSDAATFKTAMSGVQLVYELATPITVDLTPLEISVLTGQTNNIWADNGNVSVEYAADLKTYIDQKIAAAVAALS